jgi:trehalose 6-phosphate synthase/phosphatase
MKTIIMVSNRLPLKLEKKGGRIELRETSGGLVTAIKSLAAQYKQEGAFKIKWVGCADFKETDWVNFKPLIENTTLEVHPVFINKNLERKFYQGFSNSTIWPLFHYFPSFVEFDENLYAAYEFANKLLAEKVSNVCKGNEVIWVHDYHFMLLPGYLRDLGIKNPIGFFLHIPFPSYELFRILPEMWREEIIRSLVGSDLIGLQTPAYVNHFRETSARTLGRMEDFPEETLCKKINDYPISIDFNQFDSVFDNKIISQNRRFLKLRYQEQKIIFSVDRLDYTKGVMNRLEAYEQLLNENPEYIKKIVFILNVVPSRDEIGKYRERKKMIEENIGRINGKYGSVEWQPIIYQYRHLTFNQLVAFYTACDIALVTPLRDGMNLVAKEFVASRRDEKGVLILSDMAGVADTFNTAIKVTPTDIRKMKDSIISALTMPEEEQQTRMRSMRQEVRKNNIEKWASRFLMDLNKLHQENIRNDSKILVL